MARPRLRGPAVFALGLLALATASSSCGPAGQGPSKQYVGTPARLAIGPAGGSLTSSDGNLTVTVPAGALSAPVDVVIYQYVNPAPGGQGNAYELAPAGQLFALPVTLTFKNPTLAGSTPMPTAQLWLSFLINPVAPLQGQGLWFRAGTVTVDGTANTLTTAVPDFSWTDWSVVATGPNVGNDLVGIFTLVSTLEVPFTASTTQLTLAYAGEDPRATYYFPLGPLTLQTPVTLGTVTCNPVAPPGATVQVKSDAVVELRKVADPIPLLLPIDAIWNLTCSDGSTALADTRFDTLGISLGSCTRGYVGTPRLTTSRIQCDAGNGCYYHIDCGTRGTETATFDLGPCTPGVACTSPTGLCDTAAISCTTGLPVCTDTGTLPNGTPCGSNLVCGDGVCNACVQGAACTSTNPCTATATIDCSSGFPVCTDQTFLATGTSCGTNLVCSATGVCSACTEGAACTPTTPNPCATSSTIECSSGAPVCTDQTFLAAGTSCGTNLVCSATGVCSACTEGAACTPTTPNPCATSSTIECSSGAPVCTERTFLAAGTSCGTNLVCSATGVCTSCTQGEACTSTNPCAATATIECSSGAPVCTDQTFLADGTSCGTGLTCNAGACVQSRTVTGTRMVTYWPDTGPTVPVPAPELAVVPPAPPVQVAALVRDGKGGWITYPGTFPTPGNFSIPNVPVGPYLLAYVDAGGTYTFADTPADAVDLGYDEAGRAGLVLASASTPVTFDLTGLNPWNTGGDQLQITCSDADVWDLLAPTVAALATSGTAADDWLTGNGAPAPLPLLSNDTLLVHQLATATDSSSGNAFQYASNWSALAGVTLTNGAPAILSPGLAAISPLEGSLPAATWSLSQFDLLASMNPAAATDASAHSLVVGASRFPLASPGPAPRGSPLLLAMRLPRGTTPDPAVGALGYGQFLGTAWNEWRGVDFTVHVSYSAPGATSSVEGTASVGRREAMPPPPGAIAPTLTPVQSPLVAGQNAFSSLTGVGPTPSLSWTAPATGAPTRYVVELFRLDNLAGASAAIPVAIWVTNDLSVSLPPGVLAVGNVYFARITADLAAGDPLGAATPAPLRLPATYAYASALTGTFAP